MLIDCHTHAFADKIADKAVEQLIDYYQIQTSYGGRFPDLLQQAVRARLNALVLLVAATKPQQVKPANDWMLALSRTPSAELQAHYSLPYLPRIVPFGTLHTDDPHWQAEVARLRAAGIRGIKLHPEFQGIDLADPRLLQICEEIAGDFVLMVHVGDPHVSPENLSTPAKIVALLRNVPTLTMIVAHMGGYCFWEDAYHVLAGKSVYFDTSSASAFMPPPLMKAIIDRHGTERILMGSDYPLTSPGEELARLSQLPWLTTAQREAICGGNAARLLGLSDQ